MQNCGLNLAAICDTISLYRYGSGMPKKVLGTKRPCGVLDLIESN